MKVLSLFSGVGGFDLGLEAAGMETVFQCEWDKHATSILQRHWPDVPRWGDITTLTGKHILAHAPVIDVVAWGSPCQDLSVAGKRAGLEGSRSGLFHEGVRIIKELRKETNNEYPRISIWENVYGALNSNRGADFGVILNEMAEAGSLVQEWRVLDAQYFGVPQRRRRVFLISVFDSATAARCPDPLLPVSEGVQWHPSTSNQARQTVAGETSASFRSGGFRMRGFGDYESCHTASAIKARDHKDATDLVIEPPILIDRAAFNQGINAQYNTHISDDPVSPSLVARGPHAVAAPIGFSHTQGLSAQPSEAAWPTLRTEGNGMAVAIPIHDQATRFAGKRGDKQDGKGNGLGIGSEGDPMNTLTSTDRHAVAYDEYNDTIGGEVHHALRAGTKQSTGVVIDAAAGFKVGQGAGARSIGYEEEMSSTLPSDAGGNKAGVLTPTMAVRRLTPLECERLMGWPDGWTATKADGTPQTDTHRYKQCGNGIASPVAQWIAQQLLTQLTKDTHETPQITT
jgi:DNA (cytosine-5)-methyltransferase 1